MGFEDDLDRETAEMLAVVDREASRMVPDIERESAALIELAQDAAHREAISYHEDPVTETRAIISRRDYVPKEAEQKYVIRGDDGRPILQFVDAGDRFAIWSPGDGGVLLNPKGPGLRRLGLFSSYARGSKYYAQAFRKADLRKGRVVELRREPENPHDRNAVAFFEKGASKPFGYVQRGRAAAISGRLSSGEQLTGVCLRGPGPGHDDESALLILGATLDLEHMLRR